MTERRCASVPPKRMRGRACHTLSKSAGSLSTVLGPLRAPSDASDADLDFDECCDNCKRTDLVFRNGRCLVYDCERCRATLCKGCFAQMRGNSRCVVCVAVADVGTLKRRRLPQRTVAVLQLDQDAVRAALESQLH